MKAILKLFILMGVIVATAKGKRAVRKVQPVHQCHEAFAQNWEDCKNEVAEQQHDHSYDPYDLYECVAKKRQWFFINDQLNVDKMVREFASEVKEHEYSERVEGAVRECAEEGNFFGVDKTMRLLHFTDCWIDEDDHQKLWTQAYCQRIFE